MNSRRGWLNLDVDVLRDLLGTASVDFLQAGAEVRPLALAVLREQISAGGKVIFPQLFFTPEEASEFEAAVITSGGRVRRTMLHEDAQVCWRRVEERARRAPSGSIECKILDLLANTGGLLELQRIEQQLSAWSLLPEPPHIISSSTPYNEIASLAIAQSAHQMGSDEKSPQYSVARDTEIALDLLPLSVGIDDVA